MNRKEPIAPWGALNLETGETLTTHVKVTHGKCLVCGHFGEDCTGTAPAKILVLKQVIDLYPRMVNLLEAALPQLPHPFSVTNPAKHLATTCVACQIQALLKGIEK